MTVSFIKNKYIYFHLYHRKNKDKKIWYSQNNIIKEINNIINEIEDYENKLIGLNRKDNSILDELD